MSLGGCKLRYGFINFSAKKGRVATSLQHVWSIFESISINMPRSNLRDLYLTADDLYDRQAILNADVTNAALSVHDIHFGFSVTTEDLLAQLPLVEVQVLFVLVSLYPNS